MTGQAITNNKKVTPYMEAIFLDFETYYDKEYSLRKMTPVQYILDPRFEVIGCAIKRGADGVPFWLEGDQLKQFFAALDPEVTCMVTHNALFDMCIVAWHYNFVPRLMLDTLGAARACLGHVLPSLSLDSVAKHLGLGAKGGTVHKVIGMNALAIKQAGLHQQLIDYALHDVTLCAGIYGALVRTGVFPRGELAVMDMVLRCAVQPQFVLDRQALCDHLGDIQRRKAELLQRVGGDRDVFMSNDKFAGLLRSLGVEPPTKTSPVTGKVTYAFAKTDTQFLELEEHEDPLVQAAVQARLGTKSTLEETRTQRLIDISHLQWPNGQQCLMPMPLRFSGAHTHRLSGDWKLNVQNLPVRKGNAIRRAFAAPPGHQVIAPDASQIEARIVAWLCGQWDLVELFATGADPYSAFAGDIFGYPVNKAMKNERFLGKTSILGLGFGMGWPKFQHTVKIQSLDQLGTLIELPDAEALRIVNLYRSKNKAISDGWDTLRDAIPLLQGDGGGFSFGPCKFEHEAILLPNGLKLHYHNLRQFESERGFEWGFTFGGKPKRIYGGKLLENIVQALARIVVMDAGVRIQRRLAKAGIRLALQVHDELVYVVPDRLVAIVKAITQEEMQRRPLWAPDLPLASECDVGPSYGAAK